METIQPSTLNISLTIEEYSLACYILESPGMFGIRNLSSSQDSDQIRAVLERGKVSLVNKELLAVDVDGNVELDYILAKMVSAVCQAPLTFAAHKSGLDTAQELFIHIDSDLIVEQYSGSNGVELTALENSSTLLERMQAWLAFPDAPAAPGKLLELEVAVLDEARQAALSESLEASEKIVLAHQAPAPAARVLAAALGKHGWTGSLTLLDRSKEQPVPVETLGWLGSSAGCYIVLPSQKSEGNHVLLVPVTAAGIWERVERMVDSATDRQAKDR